MLLMKKIFAAASYKIFWTENCMIKLQERPSPRNSSHLTERARVESKQKKHAVRKWLKRKKLRLQNLFIQVNLSRRNEKLEY